jgi:hypothetical protein
VAKKAGINPRRLNLILYDKRRTPTSGYDKEYVANILARLHDRSAPPSTYQLNQIAKRNKPVFAAEPWVGGRNARRRLSLLMESSEKVL